MLNRIRLAPVLVSAALIAGAATLASPSATTAAAESDIPGIPMPGAVATGLLGGPIYDVVYRLDVQPGYVIVAGVTGTAGTDFDLYLFDASATTVVSNRGLLAKSTGPTSSENLSYPSFAGGTYYVDLNGATDVEGTYTLTVQLVADQAAPVASLLLADGRPAVNTTSVNVRVTASATLSGIGQMAFSPDGVTFGAWQTYTAQTTWTFPPGDGVKRLWAKVRSGVGVESAVTQDAVLLDTVPPSPSSIDPVPGASVPDLRPTFRVSFNEPIEPSSWTQLGLVVQAANGQLVDGTYTYDLLSTTGTFVPGANLIPGAQYVVTIGQVRDVAGNVALPLSSWTVTPLRPTSLGMSISRGLVAAGDEVILEGTASGLDGEDVLLSIRPGGSTSGSEIGPFVPDAGRLTSSQAPAMTTWYRWVYPGSPTNSASQSPELRVLVRRAVTLIGASAESTRTVTAGATVSLVAKVTPSGPVAKLSFQRYRYDATRRTYVYGGSFGRTTDANGLARLDWVSSVGRYYWRALVLPSPEYANNITPMYRWTVSPR